MAITAKYVRTYSHAGGTVNFTSVAGDSHRSFWLSTDLIKTMLERNIKVYEQLKVVTNGVKEIELTLENYNQDNNGKVLPVDEDIDIIDDLELIRAKELKDAHDDHLVKLGLEIKKKNDARIEKINSITGGGDDLIEESEESNDDNVITAGGDDIVEEESTDF